jgi:hypothetical protein
VGGIVIIVTDKKSRWCGTQQLVQGTMMEINYFNISATGKGFSSIFPSTTDT